MNINTVVLSGNLTADADITECQEKPGRFKIEFRLGVNKRRRPGASELSTFIGVKMFATERAAEYFAQMLYRGREVVVSGELDSHASLGEQGKSNVYYYIDAKSVEVVPETREPRNNARSTATPEPAQAKPEPRKLQVQRPVQDYVDPEPPAYHQEYRSSTPATPAQLYRNKGVVEQAPVTEANADNLLRW